MRHGWLNTRVAKENFIVETLICRDCGHPKAEAYCCGCINECPWETKSPLDSSCCICGKEVPLPFYEDRPTGQAGGMQRWRYCEWCGRQMQEMRIAE